MFTEEKIKYVARCAGYPIVAAVCWIVGAAFAVMHAGVGDVLVKPESVIAFLESSCFAQISIMFLVNVPVFIISWFLAIEYKLVAEGRTKDRGSSVLTKSFVGLLLCLFFGSICFLLFAFCNPPESFELAMGSYAVRASLGSTLFQLSIGLISCLLYYLYFFKGTKSSNHVRFTLIWPSLYIVGLNLLCGYACTHLSTLNELALGWSFGFKMMIFACVLFVCSLVYLACLFSKKDEAGLSDPVLSGKGIKLLSPSGFHIKMVMFITLVCFFFGLFQCILALLLCIFIATFEAWVIIPLQNDKMKELYIQADNIAVMALLFFVVVIVSFSIPWFGPSDPLEQGVAVYYIIVTALLVVATGNYGNKIIRQDTKMGLRKACALACTIFLLVIVPALFRSEMTNLGELLNNAGSYAKLIAAFTSLLVAFSAVQITVSLPKESDAPWPKKLIEAIRKKLNSYIDPDTYSTDKFHRTFSEVITACIVVALVCGYVFTASSKYFFAYSLVLSFILVVSLVYAFIERATIEGNVDRNA